MLEIANDKTNTDSFEMTGKCPFGGDRIAGATGTPPALSDWYPDRLKVEMLHSNGPSANPLGEDFNYAEAFNALDLEALKQEIKGFLTTSVDWWPSDYNNYGPQMIRMAWHSAGTYRIADGRGGAGEALQRFAPINSWWDNGNTDKSRRLIAPIKQKYGSALSWADLIVLTGNCALEIMGFPTYGFAGGRHDAWEADVSTYWGPEVIHDLKKADSFDSMVMRDKRWRGKNGDADYDLENPLAATHQSLIYVNPEGPYGDGDALGSARDIRVSFSRMAMNNEETVALIAGGHAFGKSHGMVKPDRIGAPPEIAPIEAMGMGWHNPQGKGHSEDTMTNGIEGSWTPNPTQWDNDYLINLFKFEWEQTKSPAGALQWTPVDKNAPKTPDAHIEGKMNDLMMMTTDIALKVDPEYRAVCEKFLNDFDAFTQAFSKAWYKLTHRDMGPRERYLGPEKRNQNDLLWQDPIPLADYDLIDAADITALKESIMATDSSVSDLVYTAFSSAVTHRSSDKRGGANGARLALAPQKDWDINQRTVPVVAALRKLMEEFNGQQQGNKQVSLADLLVLGGCAALEKAAADAGFTTAVPFTPGRRDTTQELTDIEMFTWLKPVADGFRNYLDQDFAAVSQGVAPEEMFLDKAQLLSLTSPEWVALTGGLKAMNANHDNSKHGVFTDRVGVLTNDFFTVLTSMDFEWKKADTQGMMFALEDRKTGQQRFTATRSDLIFGSNSQLRAVAEVYAGSDGQKRFVKAFVKAWDKVMMLDRYDVKV
ncbi:catalase/peroxidase HPI [Hymenobacter rubripertinctus]|uniref:Catalase-peroxidase n=1 Tax=Hymenobacter rubripertinctus TaxID=2029981 RepID=A0A418QMC0_9BACT|nr:catalase/peroxidase HPI [Hymenobacter rubripertinctus]RIY06377.1 catalase/peroxidase HPI [Hymenobacter rubripertinctus]